jgi:hypothetical protein
MLRNVTNAWNLLARGWWKKVRKRVRVLRPRTVTSDGKENGTRPWVKDIIIQSAKIGVRLLFKRACGYQKEYESK